VGISASASVGIAGGFIPGGLTNGGVGAGAPTGKFNLLQNGGDAGGVNDNGPALNALAATIGAAVGTIYLPAGSYAIKTNCTIPANITLELAAGASFAIDAGKTLTVNGPTAFPFAQIFFGAGGAAFGRSHGSTVPPQWWGAVADGVHDDTAAFQAAFSAKNGMMYLPAGNYRISGFDAQNSELTIRGEGRDVTFINGDNDLILNVGTLQGRVRFQDLSFDQSAYIPGKMITCTTGAAAQRAAFVNVDFLGGNYHIYSGNVATSLVDWYFEGCRFRDALITSRYLPYVIGYTEAKCYSGPNAEGLKILAGLNIDIGGVFEQHTGYAINLLSSSVAVGGIWNALIHAYFENNSQTAHLADVNIETAVASRIRCVDIQDSTFKNSGANPVSVRLAGANVSQVGFRHVVSDAPQLCTAGFAPALERVEMSTGVFPADAFVIDQQSNNYVPAVTTGTGTVTLDAAYNTLQYTKTGKLVHVQGLLRLSAIAAPTGTVHISLPFAPATGVNHSNTTAAVVAIDKMAATWTGAPMAVLLPGAQYIALYELAAGALSAPAAKLAATCDMYISCTYETDN